MQLPAVYLRELQHRDRVAQIATQQGGVIVALDGFCYRTLFTFTICEIVLRFFSSRAAAV